MMAPGHLDAVRAIVRTAATDKVTHILEGAETRNGTTLRALDAIADPQSKVLFHDAVRPLVSARIISECFEALDNFDAVDVAIPSADTIIEVDDDNTIQEIPPRRQAASRPDASGLPVRVIKQAYEIAGRTRTSSPPTTAPSCSATCPTSDHGGRR